MRTLGAPAKSDDAFPSVQHVPDLSGDGRDDIAVISSGSKPRLEVRRETDAGAIWSTTSLTLVNGVRVQSAGRVTGATAGAAPVPDLALVSPPTSTATDELTGFLPIPAKSAHGTVALVSGKDGSLVWSKTGDATYAVEHAGPKLVGALGVTSSETTSTSDTTTTTLTLTTYDIAGSSLYTVSRSASIPTSSEEGGGGGVGLVYETGHLTASSAVDGTALIFVASGDSYRFDEHLFAGQTGKDLPSGTSTPLWGSTTGHGDDLVSTSTQGTVTVTVRRGTDAKPRFSTKLPLATGYNSVEAYGALLQRGRCADVIVNDAGKDGRRLSAVLASDGRLRWLITHKDTDLRPGTVKRAGTAPHPRCS
jgi:hypothetical protein